MSPQTIGIFLFDEMEELDAVGPWEVLAWWTKYFPQDGWTVTTFSPDGEPVTCAKGMRICADHSLDSAPELDILIHPGGRGTRTLLGDDAHLAWLRAQRRPGRVLASVCTGSLVFAAAGLLEHRAATSYHTALGDLVGLSPTTDVRAGARYVDEGEIITSAGVSAGIDMSLHLVARLAGAERAEEVRAGIEYLPGWSLESESAPTPPALPISIRVTDPRVRDVAALLATHLAFGRANSPPADVHALDLDELLEPAVTLYALREGDELRAVGALKVLDETHAEIKSMHTVQTARRLGYGRTMLEHLIATARDRGLRRLSLETGSQDAFAPARDLYTSMGFVETEAFDGYAASANSTFMTRRL